MTNIKNGTFQIGTKIISRDTVVEDFADSDQFHVYDMEDLIIVESAPETIEFLGADFLVEMYFYDRKVERIILYPDLKDYTAPNYPDESYQRAKWNHCVGLLIRNAGIPDESDDRTVYYKFGGGVLFTQMVLDGREPYTGGNIIIDFER